MIKISKNFKPRTSAFPHQEEAIKFVYTHKDVAIFDEQGLGKSKIVIDSLAIEIKEGRIHSVIIICKKSLIKNWQEEIETHSHLSSVLIKDSKIKRGNLFTFPVHFMIIGYETAVNEIRTIKQLLSIRKIAIVLDESHKIKNELSKVTKALHNIAPLATQRIILSGTPVANKPEDLWAQFFFLDMGKLLGNSLVEFKNKYKLNNIKKIDSNQTTQLKHLREQINKKSIRRLKNNVLELPNKVYKNIMVPLLGLQNKMYQDLREQLLVEITDLNDKQVIDETKNILKKLLRLTQIASNPAMINKQFKDTPAKFIVLDREVKKIIKRSEKVIIWSGFVDNIVSLKRRYKEYGAVTIYGRMNIEQRNDAICRFKNDSSCHILIANPAAAREGLTLTVANNAIYLDRNFNLVDYLQSQDRIHRISQTKKCNIILLLAENTVDEYIDEIIFKKSNVAGFIQGDINKITDYVLTRDEIVLMLED